MGSCSREADTPTAGLDMSQVRPQAKLGISGIEQVMDVLLYGTLEVKQYLAAECDIIFECKICRSLFRALPNFIGHKRMYCTEKTRIQLNPIDDDNQDKETEHNSSEISSGVSEEIEKADTAASSSHGRASSIQEHPKTSAGVVASRLPAAKVPTTKGASSSRNKSGKPNVKLSKLEAGERFTYAEVVDFSKNLCKLCGLKVVERRHLVDHVKNYHSDRLYFLQCPQCPQTFFVTGNLTRHLKNAHGLEARAADVALVMPGMNTYAMSQSKNEREKDEVSETQHLTNSSSDRNRKRNLAQSSTIVSSRSHDITAKKQAPESISSTVANSKKSSSNVFPSVRSDDEDDETPLANIHPEKLEVKKPESTMSSRNSSRARSAKEVTETADLASTIAPKLTHAETIRRSSSQTSNLSATSQHLRSALTSSVSLTSRSLRKQPSATANEPSSHSLVSDVSTVRSSRRLSSVKSVSSNSSSATESAAAPSSLDFHCRHCRNFQSVTLSECVQHCLDEHGIKIDRRDTQPHIETTGRRMEAVVSSAS